MITTMLFPLAGLSADMSDMIAGRMEPEKVIEETVKVSEPMHEPESLGQFKITAYCPCVECSGVYGRHTATGHIARSGHTIAIDPAVIPYGTHVIIAGQEYVAEDCGGGVKGRHVDIYMDCHTDTTEFGVKWEEVYQLE